jgi:hypothetical protein
LTKGEQLQILNNRPKSLVELFTVIIVEHCLPFC